MIDENAFRSLSYGLYLISSQGKDKAAGCVVNTFAQVTAEPSQVIVSMNKENHTTSVIQESGRYIAVSLAEDAPIELIRTFGFYCSRDIDKFESYLCGNDETGTPYIAENVVGRFTVEVTDSVDVGTHILFIGTVVEAEILSEDPPMTYAHYHTVKGGKTPPRAPSYTGDSLTKSTDAQGRADADEGAAKYAWRCTVCGHIEYVEELPEDFTCPICGVGRELFERIEL